MYLYIPHLRAELIMMSSNEIKRKERKAYAEMDVFSSLFNLKGDEKNEK